MRHRVFVYITRHESLLVLDYVDCRYLLSQIPGGTVKDGETPEQAALREASEESGLTGLELVKFLGSFEKDLAEIGRNEIITAWFYHLKTTEPTPETWTHFENDPSEGGEPIEFKLRWVPLDNIPDLGGIDAMMLIALKESFIENIAN